MDLIVRICFVFIALALTEIPTLLSATYLTLLYHTYWLTGTALVSVGVIVVSVSLLVMRKIDHHRSLP